MRRSATAQNGSYINAHSHSLLNQNFMLAILFQSNAPKGPRLNLSALISLGVGLGVRDSCRASTATSASSLVGEFEVYIAFPGGG